MKKLKLFSLALMALFTTSAWGATVTMDKSLGTSTTPLTSSPYIYNNTTAGVVIYSSKAVDANWTKTSSPGSAQSDFKPVLYNLVNGSSLSSAKGIYSATGSNPNTYKPQSAKYYTLTFTNCTQVKVSGTGGGTADDKQLVYVIKEGNTVIDSTKVTTKKDMSNPETATSSKLSADKTYTIKICATGANDTYILEVAFYYPICSAPTTTFANGSYTVGGDALDLSSLISNSNSDGAIAYSVKNANGTGASIDGAYFTATAAGTCTVTATQAADDNHNKCEKIMDATITVNPAPVANPVITFAVNPAGYGTVSEPSITVNQNDEVNISANTFACGGYDVTAAPTAATAEYTYAFNSWSGVNDGDKVVGNITVTANFTRTPNNYTLAWNANGGDELTGDYTNGSTAYGTTIVKPNTPTRSGYAFTGWAESESGDVIEVPTTMPATNKTYYAQWMEQITPTITFNNGAYKVSNQTLDLSSLFTSNSAGAVTYTIKTDGGTTSTINGTKFFATKAGSCVVTASQAAEGSYAAATADATITVSENEDLLVMVRLSGSAGATKTYSGTAYENVTAFTQNLSNGSPYKLSNDYRACVALTLTSGYFQAGDSVVMDLSKTGQMYCGTLPEDKDKQTEFPAGTTSLGTTTTISGIEYFILPKTLPENTTTIFTSRPSSTYNGTLTYMAVFRDNGGTTAIDNTEEEVKAVKFFKDGQLFIEKNGHVYNVFGACVK